MIGAVIGIAYTLIKNKVAQKKQATDGISGDSTAATQALTMRHRTKMRRAAPTTATVRVQSSAENFNGDGAAPQSSDGEVKK